MDDSISYNRNMQSILIPTIALALTVSACFTPPKKPAADFAPQQLSFHELTEINAQTFFSENGSSVAGDYVFSMNAESVFLDGAATDGGVLVTVPFAIGPDGFELTFRSTDIKPNGFLDSVTEIPEFKARITASNASGMYLRGTSAETGTQHAYLNADVCLQIKNIVKPLALIYSDPLVLEEMDLSMFQGMSGGLLATLIGKAVGSELTLTLDRVEGNLFYYNTDFAHQGYNVIKEVLSQVDEDDLLDFATSESQELGNMLAIFLSLDDEQIEPILPAFMNLFNIESEYVLGLTDKNEIIAVSYSLHISALPPEEMVDHFMELQNVLPAEFGLPAATKEQSLARIEQGDLDCVLGFTIDLFGGIKNLDLSSIAVGNFDFEKPEKAIDYSEMVGPQLPMIESMINSQMQNGALFEEDADQSEVF